MTTQPEALRLAEVSPYLEGGERGQWIIDAAAELRRLYEAHDWQYKMAGERLRRVEKLEAQRDALLEALRKIGRYTGEGPMHSTPWQDIVADLGQIASAAIKAVEGEKE